MKLAIPEDVLPGQTLEERLDYARQLNLDGIEFKNDGLAERVPAILEALENNNLAAAAVYVGGTDLIHPDFDQRETALVTLRQAMANMLDLDATGVIFSPHKADTPRLPDLHPYKSSLELEAELFVKQLKTTLADLAYAMGAQLLITTESRHETHLLHRLEQAAVILQRNKDHPHVKIAADTAVLALEESNPYDALRQHIDKIAYIRLAEVNRQPPQNTIINFAQVITILQKAQYDGWLTIMADPETPDLHQLLPQSVELLRDYLKS